jgi:aspartyl-tRNA(Asn)/glutamyl-tRNA(Gln) amidotransferase subunit B
MPKGATEYGTRTEVKNMNSFHSVFMALNYEEERQRKVLEEGGRVVQETRGWVDNRNITVSQRSKEYAHDYRYLPEPDLPPLIADPAWVQEIKDRIPELASQRRDRFEKDYGLPEYDAGLLTGSKELADFYESAMDEKKNGASLEVFAKNVSNWMLGDLSRLLNAENLNISDSTVTPAHLAELVDLVDSQAISVTMAKTVLEEAFSSGEAPAKIVRDQGYTQISDASALESAVNQAIAANPKAVADFMEGKENAAKFLVGQVMKATRGQAKPELVNTLVSQELEARKNDPPPATAP